MTLNQGDNPNPSLFSEARQASIIYWYNISKRQYKSCNSKLETKWEAGRYEYML